MKMLLVIYRQSLDEDVRALLHGLKVRAFTEAPKVFGIGDAGQAFDTFEWPGFNSMILSVMDDAQANEVIEAIRSFHARLATNQRSGKIPLRMFVLPCEQVI